MKEYGKDVIKVVVVPTRYLLQEYSKAFDDNAENKRNSIPD